MNKRTNERTNEKAKSTNKQTNKTKDTMRQKKIGVLLALGLNAVSASSLLAQAITIVEDDNKNNQIQREVLWYEWDGHTPGWFYWIYELFQDDPYRDKDRRNIIQLLPTVAMTQISKEETDKQKKYTDAMAQDKAFILADLTVDYAYSMISNDMKAARNHAQEVIAKAQALGVYPDIVTKMTNEYVRIEGRITAIRNSDLSNADRQKGYQIEVESLRKLAVMGNRMVIVFKSIPH